MGNLVLQFDYREDVSRCSVKKVYERVLKILFR